MYVRLSVRLFVTAQRPLPRGVSYTTSPKMSKVWLAIYSFNTHPPIFKNNFWHMSSADIQKSATGITFSTTSLLLTLFCSEVNRRKWCVLPVAIRDRCRVNMFFSADHTVLIKSLYQFSRSNVGHFWGTVQKIIPNKKLPREIYAQQPRSGATMGVPRVSSTVQNSPVKYVLAAGSYTHKRARLITMKTGVTVVMHLLESWLWNQVIRI